MAPKPTPLKAAPTPGSQTAANILFNPARAVAAGATRRSRATSSRLASGASVVAIAIPEKP